MAASVRVLCDVQDCRGNLEVFYTPSIARAREAAKALGWTTRRGGRALFSRGADFCPSHANLDPNNAPDQFLSTTLA